MLKRQRGQGLVEFALITPVLLLIILAIIEMALIFQGYLAVQHAAREAARWAVVYRPERGRDINGNPCDGSTCSPSESESEYWARRVRIIKQKAVEHAVGLRIDEAKLGLTQATFDAYIQEPNFYGVEVWGFPSFAAPSGGWTDTDLRDHPGLQGLPVRVRVTHNVELLDPLFRAIVPRVRVTAQTEMINEGTQAGQGNQAPPALPPAPTLPPGPGPGPGTPVVDFIDTVYYVGEGEGAAIITLVLFGTSDDPVTVNYTTSDQSPSSGWATAGSDYTTVGDIITFEPGETVKTFSVPILEDEDEEQNEELTLTLSGGNATLGPNNPAKLVILDNDGEIPEVDFSDATYTINEDGGSATIAVQLTSSTGSVVTVDYTTVDDTALSVSDYTAVNDTLVFNPGETSQTFSVPIIDDVQYEGDETLRLELSNPINATIGSNHPATLTIVDDDAPPTPTPSGPFISVSDYDVIPTQLILIDVNQHVPNAEYELRWVNEAFTVIDVISPTLRVDDSGFKRDILYEVPVGSEGSFYIETERGGSTVRSEPLQVVPPPPDLVVRSIGVPEEIEPNEEMTVTVEIENLMPSVVSGYFDVDLYVDPDEEPLPSQPGASKQWVLDIGASETKVVTHVVTLYGGGAHELWAQVDTSNWVPGEFDEDNNVYGPLGVTAASGECSEASDRFYDPELDAKWSAVEWGDASVHNQTIEEIDGESTLTIETSGTKIGSYRERATFLYQPFTGDFVATLKINWGPDTGTWAKIGLMMRANLNDNSPMVAVSKTNSRGLQFLYRRRAGDSAGELHSRVSSGLPAWVRIVRTGDAVSAFYSFDGSAWSEADGETLDNLPETVYVGIGAASYSSSSSTGNVDDFEICPISSEADTCQGYSDDFEADSPVVWSDVDIGNTLPGSSSKSGGEMIVEGDGSGLWGTDNFHYTYQQVGGNFVATLKILENPTQNQWSKAGLMVRASADPAEDQEARVMVMKTRDGGVQFGYRETNGGSAQRFGSDTNDGTLPVWVRISRNGNAFSAFYSTDGQSWNFGGSTTVAMPEEVMIGLAVSSYSGSQLGTGRFDDFLFCAGEAGAVEPPIAPPDPKPPGLKECVSNPQTLDVGGFEQDPYAPPWVRNLDAARSAARQHSGNFSMRFKAKKSRPPAEQHLRPWAYQSVEVPADVLTDTTGTLTLWQFVEPDLETRDPDDHFYLAVRDSGGVTITSEIPLAHGDQNWPVFQQTVISVENHLPGNGFLDLAGQEFQLFFYGVHDGDLDGTLFYMDDVRFDLCTVQPIPDPVPGTASFGGLIEVLLAGVPTKMPGIQVWASHVGGDTYRTQTIHDSTYHFYNVPPGTYTIYAEVWVGGYLYSGTAEIEVAADERNYSIDLLLQ